MRTTRADSIVAAIVLALTLLPAIAGAEPAAAATETLRTRTRGKGGQTDFLGGLTFTSQRGPVTIVAKELEFDYGASTLTYRGNVTVTQADMTLNSKLLRVTLDREAPDEVREVLAEGDVRISQGSRVATGGRAVFDQNARTVVLSDHAVLREGLNEVAGERVIVYLDEARSVVEGGDQRVRAVLFPPSGEPEPGGAEQGP